jgi:hypothetical protein
MDVVSGNHKQCGEGVSLRTGVAIRNIFIQQHENNSR